MPLLTLTEFNDMSGHEERTAKLNALRCKDFGLNSSGQMMQLLSLASVGPAPQVIIGEVTAPAVLKSNSTRRSGHQRKDAVNPV